MKKIALLICAFLFTQTLFAKPKAYFEVEDRFWYPNPRIVVDGNEYKPGFWGIRGLPEAFASNPKAQAYAESFDSYRKCTVISMWAGLGAALAYLVATSGDDYDSGTYWSIFGVGFVTGTMCAARGQTKLRKAINTYNGVYDPEPVGYKITPIDKGLGLAIRF